MKKILLFCTITFSIVLFSVASCKKNDPTSTTCGSAVCTYTLQSGETAGTTPAGIVGKYSLTYYEVNSGGPFKAGDKADFELTADNKMIVTFANDCIVLENPVQTSPSEVAFKDNCKHNASFAASKTPSGGLNEINVSSGSSFYGQFR